MTLTLPSIVVLSLILTVLASCSHDEKSPEETIRDIQNAQFLRDLNTPKPKDSPETSALVSHRPKIKAKAKRGPEADGFDVNQTTGKVNFTADVVYFGFDDATLTADGMEQLKSLAEYMEKHEAVSLHIEGHCDSRGSAEYNLALGQRRSESVRKYLTSLNIPRVRLKAKSYGEEKLVELGDAEESQAKNRRVEFNFTGKTVGTAH